MSTAIVWFRRDLRLQDNPALAAACQQHDKIIPLFIANEVPKQSVGSAQRWWLHHSLLALKTSLLEQGLDLCLRQGDVQLQLDKLIAEHHVESVYWNRCYEPALIARDTEIKAQLRKAGLDVFSFNASLLHEPWTIKNKSAGYFKVYTPYWKHVLSQIHVPVVQSISKWPTYLRFESDCLDDWDLLPTKPNWASGFGEYWQPGEIGALEKLNDFIVDELSGYKLNRDKPALSSTSYLSPHLHFGEIGPWQIWRAIHDAKLQVSCDVASADHFLQELGWREFSTYLLYHFPELPAKNFRAEFDAFPWHEDQDLLSRWQQGRTGYPIVDAGMRELWHTGYMHNRVRMIAASFLIKHLLIDWRVGAEWFLDTLLDADLANNSASWQWVAGSGVDAAPYFRIFNPILQGEKFDVNGEYVKHWIPELAGVGEKWIHKPWEAPVRVDYPRPIVDHDLARKRALECYHRVRQVVGLSE